MPAAVVRARCQMAVLDALAAKRSSPAASVNLQRAARQQLHEHRHCPPLRDGTHAVDSAEAQSGGATVRRCPRRSALDGTHGSRAWWCCPGCAGSRDGRRERQGCGSSAAQARGAKIEHLLPPERCRARRRSRLEATSGEALDCEVTLGALCMRVAQLPVNIGIGGYERRCSFQRGYVAQRSAVASRHRLLAPNRSQAVPTVGSRGCSREAVQGLSWRWWANASLPRPMRPPCQEPV